MPVEQSIALKGKRILIGKPGLDGHDAGAKIIALTLRDAGAEVIYTGLRKTPETIARVAVDEDVDAVGLSILSGSHKELAALTRESLNELGAAGVPIFLGGTIPKGDYEELISYGVSEIFTAEMSLDQVVETIGRLLR